MEKSKNNEMIETKENGIFDKIKGFFKKLLKKEPKEENTEIVKEEPKTEEKQDFRDQIVIEKDEERERILKLQEKFQKGELKHTDVTYEDIRKLSELYDEQIAEAKEKIRKNQEILEEMKKQ